MKPPISKALVAAPILMLAFAEAGSAKDADRWVRFSNARYGTVAEIPEGVFEAQRPPANGDGRTFRSKDGAEIRIYGSHTLSENFASYKKWLWNTLASDGIKVTYRAEGPTFLAYSGLKAGNVVYSKEIEGCGDLHTVYASYPRAAKNRYDPIVARVARALRCEKPWDCTGGQQACKSLVPEYDDGRWSPDDM